MLKFFSICVNEYAGRNEFVITEVVEEEKMLTRASLCQNIFREQCLINREGERENEDSFK